MFQKNSDSILLSFCNKRIAIQTDHVKHDVHQNSKNRVRGKPKSRLIDELVVPAVIINPDAETREIHSQQGREEATQNTRQILEVKE